MVLPFKTSFFSLQKRSGDKFLYFFWGSKLGGKSPFSSTLYPITLTSLSITLPTLSIVISFFFSLSNAHSKFLIISSLTTVSYFVLTANGTITPYSFGSSSSILS